MGTDAADQSRSSQPEASHLGPSWLPYVGVAIGVLLIILAIVSRPVSIELHVFGVVLVSCSVYAVAWRRFVPNGRPPVWFVIATAVSVFVVAAVLPLAFLAVPSGERIRPVLGLPLMHGACLVLGAAAGRLCIRSIGGRSRFASVLTWYVAATLVLATQGVVLLVTALATYGRGIKLVE